MAEKSKRNAAIAGGVLGLFAGLVALFWPSKSDAAPKPAPKPSPVDALAKLCKTDGQPYDSEKYNAPAPVLGDLQSLGYQLESLSTSGGRAQVAMFQRRAQELGLEGMKDTGPEWVDRVVGPCTLRSLANAMRLQEEGAWPDPGAPL